MKDASEVQEIVGSLRDNPDESPRPGRPPRRRRENPEWLVVYVAFLVVLFLCALLMMHYLTTPRILEPPPPSCGPGGKKVLSSTSVSIEFSRMNPERKPMEFGIHLIRNETAEGLYRFTSNDDGLLARVSGTDIGTLTYSDLVDNEKINIGDKITMTNLASNSDYKFTIIWNQTGEQICTSTFSTPGA